MTANAKEDVLEVLLYLFENYMVEGAEMRPDQDLLNAELVSAGFAEGEIVKAFDWLDDLSTLCDDNPTDLSSESNESNLGSNSGSTFESSVELSQELRPRRMLRGGSDVSIRHLSKSEANRLGRDGYGLITMLQSAGVLDPDTRELVIDRVMALESDDIDVDHVRWVVMMVLSSRPTDDERVALWVEELVMDGVNPH